MNWSQWIPVPHNLLTARAVDSIRATRDGLINTKSRRRTRRKMEFSSYERKTTMPSCLSVQSSSLNETVGLTKQFISIFMLQAA